MIPVNGLSPAAGRRYCSSAVVASQRVLVLSDIHRHPLGHRPPATNRSPDTLEHWTSLDKHAWAGVGK